MTRIKRATALAAVVSLGLLAAACGSDSKDTTATTTGGATTSGGGAATTAGEAATTTAAAKEGGTLVFGTSADPVVLDGAYVSDGESLRVLDQLFETLVTTKPGGTEIVPELAKSWEGSADGLTWTFELQEGVKFHDGTPFNAEAVCANFDRWYNFKGVQQSDSVAYYWISIFGGFATNETPDLPPSLYKSCEAKDENTAAITITRPNAAFISGLANTSFAMASPKALTEFEADKVTGSGEAPKFEGTFGTEHPIGTGPFKFDKWVVGDQLSLVRNDDYWGTKAILDEVIFKPIADGPSRRQALDAGDIQGYDLVDPADRDALKSAGFQLLERPAFNVGYLGLNQAKKPLDNPKIRQAIAHALNRQALLTAKYPPGAEVATQFQPPELFGWSADVPKYDYDPENAKALIEEYKKETGETEVNLEFWYPTDVSRPYMPDPVANFQAFQGDLEAAGFKVTPKSAPWRPDYLNAVQNGDAPLYLIGWTGDYGDPDNFLGVFFGQQKPEWGFNNPEIFDGLAGALAVTDQAERTKLYEDMNKKIMEFLPGVPYVHTKPALAFAKGVSGYQPSPVSLESFATVSLDS